MTIAMHDEATKRVDPRVKRTRKLLEQAFIELMNEKGFEDITIQDIADRAMVNRATFYAHFEDKYDLLDSFVRQQFNEMLAGKVPLAPVHDRERLQLIIVTVLDFFSQTQKHCAPPDRQVGPVLVFGIQEELMNYLLDWFAIAQPTLIPKEVDPKAAVKVWSWAIIGTAIQWALGTQKVSAKEIAREIGMVLTAGCNPASG